MDRILMFFPVLMLSPVHAEPAQTVRKPIQACPSVGYFFERQGPDSACYLCYCKGDTEAVCTLRDSDRCNEENYSYHTEVEETTVRKHRRRKHRRRSRRSAGLTDLFFSDAKKNKLMKSMLQSSGEGCTPRSSKSIGCPPKDWCEGCLVCDCDEESQWQCHVMSFCDGKPEKPNSRKSKLIIPAGKKEEKETATQIIPIKKNSKRSTKPKKSHFRRKTTTTSTTSTKRPTTIKTRKPSIRKHKPNATAKPLISVQTKQAFRRKNKNNKDVIVIKKYISTLAPITAPELLQYRNDSRKLAQILYQQYESSTKVANHVKREIRPETKVVGKMLLTHEYTKINKIKHDTANTKNMGDKIFSMKQKTKFKLQNNARGRKPMNIKEHNDRNTKMKAKQDKRQKKSSSNFYSRQKKMLQRNENKEAEKKRNTGESKEPKGNYERKETIKLMGRMRRNKRDIPLSMEATINSTNMDNEIVNTSLLISDPVTEMPEKLFTNGEEITSNLNNYVYTVDDKVTLNYDSNREKNDNYTEYETTTNNVDIKTIGENNFDKENSPFTDVANYTTLEEVSATENELNYNLQTLNITDYNVSKGFIVNYTTFEEVSATEKELNYNLPMLNITDFNVAERLIQEESKLSPKNFSLETTIIVDDLSQNEPKGNLTTETTDLMETTRSELYNNKTKQYNITNDQKVVTKISNNTKNMQDIESIITDLNKCKPRKKVRTNNSKGNLSDSVNYNKADFERIHQNFTNSSKYRSKQNRMMVIKYLKKLYSKLLSTKNNKTLLTNVAVMESICDTFGPCKISTGSVEKINAKINELISETKTALNIIAIIKCLLQSIENGNNSTNRTTEEVEFKSYVKKLNAILTDNHPTPLSEAQLSKMKVIKSNTKVFINSIGQFARILNDILKIIHSDKSKFEGMRRGKILLSRATRQKSTGEPLHKIKKLFIKFNMLQNSFMRNMYKAISDLEMENNLNKIALDQSKTDANDRRYTTSVNKYMNKISYNLKKLKELALKMGGKERVKRDTMRDDDAVEYLLTLMEYLLKKNNPLDSPPVTDGIDLLIDAIRRAPDIKPIKNKVLYHKTTTPGYYAKDLSKSSSESQEENISFLKNHTEIKDMSFEKPYYNETQILQSNDNDIEEYKTTREPKMFLEVTTTRYVDVEDMVFNGDEIQKVYIATFRPYDNTEDPYFTKETPKPTKKKKLKLAKQYTQPRPKDDTFISTNTTETETQAKKAYPPTVKPKTQFDLLNEEYENRKLKSPTHSKNAKIKHKKLKSLKKKQRIPLKTDVSSITKEEDEERTRKKVVAEEAILRKHMINTIDYDPFKSMGEDSVSRDMSPLDGGNSEAFPSFFI